MTTKAPYAHCERINGGWKRYVVSLGYGADRPFRSRRCWTEQGALRLGRRHMQGDGGPTDG